MLPYRDTLQKRKNRENETSDQRETRRICDKENKRMKRAAETAEQREKRLSKIRERKQLKKRTNALRSINERFNRQDETQTQIIDECRLSDSDLKLLWDFRTSINKITNKLCSICNECFPSIELIRSMCHRCYYDKNTLKKFSVANNMDPGEVPEQLQGLTEIEEMLIAQIFPIISVYCLRGGQYAYRGNVINFSQNVLEFATRLP